MTIRSVWVATCDICGDDSEAMPTRASLVESLESLGWRLDATRGKLVRYYCPNHEGRVLKSLDK